MTIKQTDRQLIEQFGADGIEIFNEIERLLSGLVIQMAEVAYKGQNAFEFKTKCTRAAVDFSNDCSQVMHQISEVITDNTTFIATALGGNPINLDPPKVSVDMPKIDADTSVEMADSGPLSDLRTQVGATCDQIEAKFRQNMDNLTALGSEGWIGPEYDDAHGAVSSLTEQITADVAEAKNGMMTDITTQLQVLGME